MDDALYFTSGPGTLKSRNLAANPACSVSVRLPGIDLVLEGQAHRITDPPTLQQLATAYRTGGWPPQSTTPSPPPTAHPAPAHPGTWTRLTLHTAIGVAGAEPHGATRWDFTTEPTGHLSPNVLICR